MCVCVCVRHFVHVIDSVLLGWKDCVQNVSELFSCEKEV